MSVPLLVIGAHLSGQPLHGELLELGARFRSEALTSARYRLYRLAGEPPKPGMERVADDVAGISIPGEIYDLEPVAFAHFVARVPAPLCIGPVELSSRLWTSGFLCQHYALPTAQDITPYGGWLAWLQR